MLNITNPLRSKKEVAEYVKGEAVRDGDIIIHVFRTNDGTQNLIKCFDVGTEAKASNSSYSKREGERT